MKRVLWSGIVAGMILVAAGAGVWANQIQNGSFEDTPENCWMPPEEASHWVGYGAVPLKIFGNDTPCPWGGNPPDGMQWLGESTNYGAPKAGGAYQQVTVCQGTSGTFRALWNYFTNGMSVGRMRIGIDPTGGTDHTSSSVIWAGTQEWSWEDNGEFPVGGGFELGNWLETPVVTAIGKKVTCFLDYEIQSPAGNAVRFDMAELTGSFVNFCPETYPPDVIQVTRVTDNNVMDLMEYRFLLQEAHNVPDDATDADAWLMGNNGGKHADYRFGGVFDTAQLPEGFGIVIPSASDTATSIETQGTTNVPGTGTWRIDGAGRAWGRLTVPSRRWRDLDTNRDGQIDKLQRDGTTLAAYPFGVPNQPMTVIAKLSDWTTTVNEFKPFGEDYEGAALFMATNNYDSFMSCGAFETAGSGTAIDLGAYWSHPGYRDGFWSSWHNLQNNPVGNGDELGRRPLWLAIRRTADNRIICSYSRLSEDTLIDFYMKPPDHLPGSGLEIGNKVHFGVYLNDGVKINLDYIVSQWFPATNGPGSQIENLQCDYRDPAGNEHTLVWDASDLVTKNGWFGPLYAQLKIRAADLDGPGQPGFLPDDGSDAPGASTGWGLFSVSLPDGNYVNEWKTFE